MCAPLLAAIPFASTVGTALGTSAAAGGMVIAATAASAAAAGLSFYGQSQAVKAQNNYQKYQYEETRRLSNENLLLQYRQIGLRQQEERVALSQQIQQIEMEGREAAAQAAVGQGQSGIYGTSYDILLQDFRRQQMEAISNAELNYAMRDRQLGLEMQGMRSSAEGQVIRAMPQYQASPSAAVPILQTLGAGLGYASSMAGPGFFAPEGGGGGGGAKVVGDYSRQDGTLVRFGGPSYNRSYNPYFGGWYRR
jgi:hypothetical protein